MMTALLLFLRGVSLRTWLYAAGMVAILAVLFDVPTWCIVLARIPIN